MFIKKIGSYKPKKVYILDLCGWPKRSHEIGPVCLSNLPSESFLGIASLVFSETQHVVRNLCGIVCDRANLFEKKKIFSKDEKKGQM